MRKERRKRDRDRKGRKMKKELKRKARKRGKGMNEECVEGSEGEKEREASYLLSSCEDSHLSKIFRMA